MNFDPWWLFACLVVSSVGVALVVYGRQNLRVPQVVAGMTLIGCPFLLGSALAVAGLGGGMLAVLWLVVRLGL